MKKNFRKEILDDISHFIMSHPEITSKSAFGEMVNNDTKLTLWIQRGRGTIRTIEKIYNFMANYKPKRSPKSN